MHISCRPRESGRRSGADPVVERKLTPLSAEKPTKTFRDCAADYIANLLEKREHRQQWPSILQTYAYPIIGHVPVEAYLYDLSRFL
jgi:hypothetical protein